MVCGALAFWLSCLDQPPLDRGFSFGLTYQQMSSTPWDWHGLFPHRILLPLLAHWLQLDGERFYLAAHGSAVALLMAIAFVALRLRAKPWQALLLTVAAAVGGATQLYKSHVGYPDSLSFLLLLLALWQVRRPILPWLLLTLAAFTHEQVLFFLPCVLCLRHHLAARTLRHDWPALLVLGTVYGGFRIGIHLAATAELPPQYYFSNGYFPLGFLGVLYLAMVQTLLVFGSQLPALAYRARQANAWQRRALWLYLLAILGIYAMAHDFNRFVNFLFLPLLLAWLPTLNQQHGGWLLLAAIVAQVFTNHWLIMPVTQALYAPMAECNCLTGVPSELQKLVTFVLPRVWPQVAVSGLCLLLLLGLGYWLGARPRASPP